MTSNQNKSYVSLLVLAFQLFIAFQTLILPLTARNIKSSVVNKSNQSEILVIMASGINVTSVYNSFSDFKRMFGVEYPDERRIAFKQGEGEFDSFINIQFISMFHFIPFNSFIFSILERFHWKYCRRLNGVGVMKLKEMAKALFMNPFFFHVDLLVTFHIGMLQERKKNCLEWSRKGNYH